MNKFNHQLRQARPQMSSTLPLATKLVWGYAILNLGLFYVFWGLHGPSGVVVINSVLTYKFWALIFLTIGLGHLIGLLKNSWRIIRYSLLSGVLVKLLFEASLIISLIKNGKAILSILFIWSLITYFQIVLFAHFAPTAEIISEIEQKAKSNEQ